MDGTILQHIEVLERSMRLSFGTINQTQHLEVKIREYRTQEQALANLLSKEVLDLMDYVDMKKARMEAITTLLESAKAGREEIEYQRVQRQKREGKSPQTAISVDSPTIEGSSNPST